MLADLRVKRWTMFVVYAAGRDGSGGEVCARHRVQSVVDGRRGPHPWRARAQRSSATYATGRRASASSEPPWRQASRPSDGCRCWRRSRRSGTVASWRTQDSGTARTLKAWTSSRAERRPADVWGGFPCAHLELSHVPPLRSAWIQMRHVLLQFCRTNIPFLRDFDDHLTKQW